MHERYYTGEQLGALERRSRDPGDDRIRAVEEEWADLLDEAERLRRAEADPLGPGM